MADEYIKRDDAIARPFRFYWRNGSLSNPVVSVKNLKDIPAADVVTVRHGRNESGTGFMCSVCLFRDFGVFRGYKPSFCPNCGAKMDGGVNDAAD